MSGRLTLLNVGQGDALILHQPDERVAAIVDCAMPGAELARRYLRDHNVEKVLAVVVTHLDDDHYAGVPQLLTHVRPETLAYGTAKGYREARPQVNTFLVQMQGYQRRFEPAYVRPGDGKRIGSVADGLYLEFFGPNDAEDTSATAANDANLASAIIRATAGDLTMLLPGDAPPWRWKRLVQTAPESLNSDVLVLPHHGAAYTDESVSLETLLDLVQPRVIAVSVGSRNRYGHPHDPTLEAVGRYATDHAARLVCTQLNAACAGGGVPNGQLAPGTPCAGQITVEHDGAGPQVITETADHRSAVDQLPAPRCAPLAPSAP